MRADDILQKAAETISQRAIERDQRMERSMDRAVRAFNAITGKQLSEIEGWTFMACLKLSRAFGGSFAIDDWIDAAAYCALGGECGQETLAEAMEEVEAEIDEWVKHYREAELRREVAGALP